MDEVKSFLLELQDLGAVFQQVEDDQMTCRVPHGILTPALRQRILEQKPTLIALIREHNGFMFPRRPDGAIDFARLAVHIPPLLEGEEIPLSFLQAPCARCGNVAKVCRRSDGLILCSCYWWWYAPPEAYPDLLGLIEIGLNATQQHRVPYSVKIGA